MCLLTPPSRLIVDSSFGVFCNIQSYYFLLKFGAWALLGEIDQTRLGAKADMNGQADKVFDQTFKKKSPL